MSTSMWRVRYTGDDGDTVTFGTSSEENAHAQAALHSQRFGEATVMISDGRWDDTLIHYRNGQRLH